MSLTVSDRVAAESFVTLRGGLTVRTEAIVLLIDLEARGVKLEADAGDILIRKGSPITSDDREALRRLKPHVLRLLEYVERVQ